MLLLAVAGASWPRQKTPIPAANIMLHSSIAPPPIVKPMRKSALSANVCATAVGHKSLLLSGLSAEADLASLAALMLGDRQAVRPPSSTGHFTELQERRPNHLERAEFQFFRMSNLAGRLWLVASNQAADAAPSKATRRTASGRQPKSGLIPRTRN